MHKTKTNEDEDECVRQDPPDGQRLDIEEIKEGKSILVKKISNRVCLCVCVHLCL